MSNRYILNPDQYVIGTRTELDLQAIIVMLGIQPDESHCHNHPSCTAKLFREQRDQLKDDPHVAWIRGSNYTYMPDANSIHDVVLLRCGGIAVRGAELGCEISSAQSEKKRMNNTEYEQLRKLTAAYQGRAKEVFETWARITNYRGGSFLFAEFLADKVKVHVEFDVAYEHWLSEEEFPLEYLFSDTWVEELETKLRLEQEERKRKEEQRQAESWAIHKRIFPSAQKKMNDTQASS